MVSTFRKFFAILFLIILYCKKKLGFGRKLVVVVLMVMVVESKVDVVLIVVVVMAVMLICCYGVAFKCRREQACSCAAIW